MAAAPAYFPDPDALADDVVARVGRDIVLALPLGLGKANHVANALFARAARDSSLRLRIFTALTLEAPSPSSDLERRFIGPVSERLFAGYPGLAYARALRAGSLPENVEVNEFFFLAGRWLGVAQAQRSYISANYTHALGYVIDRGVNVVAQLVAKRDGAPATRYSLSCNPDLTGDLLAERARGNADFLLVGQVNSGLPFMGGDAEVEEGAFSHVLESPATDFPLFAPPKPPVRAADYAAGFHVARLVPDGGTLQIGIGSIGDAVAQALILRHRENDAYRETLARIVPGETRFRDEAPFREGLYGASEMLVDSFLALIDAGVLAREVDGGVLDAAFFLGPRDFYRRLRDMPEEQKARLRMRSVSFVNELYGDEAGKRRARRGARFINNAMMVTLLGAAVSDGLEDGRVVSGVGGQYNFVAQSFALRGARSIITLNATRGGGAGGGSNIRWSYGHVTIPRHLRDIVVTEYGIADLRGKTDRDVIAAMLEVTDSRFQAELLDRAKRAGKIERDFEIPAPFCDNTPERLERALAPARDAGLLPAFPFGTDFTEAEQRLIPALERLKAASASRSALVRMAFSGATGPRPSPEAGEALARMELARPSGLKERLYRLLLISALRAGEGDGA